MKLSARKSMVALGTALSLSLAPVAVPTVAPIAYAASVTESNYRSQFDSVKNVISEARNLLENVHKRMVSSEFKDYTDDSNYSEAQLKVDSAKRMLDDASGDYDNFATTAGAETYSKDNAATLRSILDRIADANTRITEAKAALNRVFTCDTSGKTTTTTNSDGSSGNSSDSLSGAVGSSGNVVVVKDGKKYCKQQSDVWVEKLSSFAKILGVVLSVITAVAALNTAVTKNNPFAPKK